MKKQTDKYIALILFFSISIIGQIAIAQKKPPKWTTRNLLDVAWTGSMPTQDLYDAHPAFSPAGILAGYRIKIKTQSVGLRTQWNLFKNSSTKNNTSFRSTTFSPSLNWHKYFVNRKSMMTYLGTGIGALKLSKENFDSNNYSENYNWYFNFYPEIGMITYLKRVPLLLNLSYNICVTRGNIPAFLSFSIGISLPN